MTTIAVLRRIAAAQESYAALLPDRENRASAFFVAASAHQVISLALRGADAPSQVDVAAVSSDICATLLFFLAEAHAHAAEAANRIVSAPNGLSAAIVSSLRGGAALGVRSL